MKRDYVLLNSADNVGIALRTLKAGEVVGDLGISVQQVIPKGHKFALRPIDANSNVFRYGQIIGVASQDIQTGQHVHVHNFGMGPHAGELDFCSHNDPLPVIDDGREFLGYHRADGSVGTRNYLGIVTTVNCAGSVANFIAQQAEQTGLLAEFGNIDGVVPIAHGTGCGMASDGEGYDTLQRTLLGYARNPNFGGILFVGLGCEVMQISSLSEQQEIRADGAFRFMIIQKEGGTRKTVARGLEQLREIAETANKYVRRPAPVSKLVIGMQCGGSDGYSAITANPSLGYASDLVVRRGGTTILSETPEIYGAEHLLIRRAVSEEVGKKLLERLDWWEDYCARNGGEMDNNPSPGNKAGGLTTILEKSLGAVAKSGTAPLVEVYEYAEKIDRGGFVFMDSPGFDPCSVTGQVASGANLIVFTTGRGSVSGFKPVPCIKLATNTEMYDRMSEDMDLNCGDVTDDNVPIEDKGEELFELLLRIASGEQTKSEALGFGGVEFVPWKTGAVM